MADLIAGAVTMLVGVLMGAAITTPKKGKNGD